MTKRVFMHLITDIRYWTKILAENKHLHGGNHRSDSDYQGEGDVPRRVGSILALLTGNENSIITYIAKRAERLVQTTREGECQRLKIIGKYYFALESVTEINLLDDDIMQAWLLYVSKHKDSVSVCLQELKCLQRFSEQQQLDCTRWGLVNYVYDIIIAALGLSRVPKFQTWLGLPISASPASTSAITVGGFHLAKQMQRWMPTPFAIGLFAGVPSLIEFVRWLRLCYPRWNFPRLCWRNGYAQLPQDDEAMDPLAVDLSQRPLTADEKKALSKRIGWEVTTLVSIWLAAVKVLIITFSDDGVDGFFSRITGGVMPPGSIDYIFIMLQFWLFKMLMEHLNLRND